MAYVRTVRKRYKTVRRVSNLVACPIIFILINDLGRQRGMFKVTKMMIFSRLGPFPQVFWQVEECLRLTLHEMIRM